MSALFGEQEFEGFGFCGFAPCEAADLKHRFVGELAVCDEKQFSAPPQRVDRRLEKLTAEIDIRRLAGDLGRLEAIEAWAGAGRSLIVRVAEGHSRSGALGEALKAIESSGISLHAIHSGRNATENAYLQLLQEDEAHGFQR